MPSIQTSGNSGTRNDTSFSTSVNVGAGNNRRFFLAVSGERPTYAAPSTFTLGGQALTLVTDGSQQANNITGGVAGVHIYELREANFPANGSQTLSVTWPGSAVNYGLQWWLLEDADQGNVRDAKVASATTASTSISVTLDAGASDDAVLCAAYKNDSTGTVTFNIAGASAGSPDADINLSTQTGRVAFDNDMTAGTAGTVACQANFTSSSRRIIVAIRVAHAAALEEITADTDLTLGAVELSADVEVVPISGGGGLADITFISLDAGVGAPPTNPRNVTVPAGTTLMVVCVHGLFMNPLTGTFESEALEVVHNSPGGVDPAGFVQMFYMLNPPEGVGELFLQGAGSGPGDAIRISCLFFSGECEFQAGSAVATSAGSTNRTTSVDKSLIVGIVQGDAGAHTPVSGATELYDDSGGSYCAYRVDATAGTYAIGATSYDFPDMVAAVFNPLETGGEEAIEADADLTLGAIELAANVSIRAQADADLTLGAVSISADADAVVSAAATINVGALELAATADAVIQADASLTLAAVELSAEADVVVSITGALQLAAAELSAAAAAVVSADASLGLAAVELDAAADAVEPTVAGDLTLGPVEVDAEAAVRVQAGAALTLGAAQLSAIVNVLNRASGALTLGAVTLDADADARVVVDAALDLPAAELAADADLIVGVDADLTLAPVDLGGSVGEVPAFVEAQVELGAVELAASVSVRTQTAANLTLPAVQLDAGSAVLIGADASLQLGGVELTAVERALVQAAAALELGAVELSALATQPTPAADAAAQLELGAVELAASVSVRTRVDAALNLEAVQLSGQSRVIVGADGTIIVPVLLEANMGDARRPGFLLLTITNAIVRVQAVAAPSCIVTITNAECSVQVVENE